MKWKTLSSKNLIDNRWIGVNSDKVETETGAIIDEFFKIRVCNASAVVALMDDKIILKSEYRYCYDRELIELPSGIFEENETDPLIVAKRELLEETGYESDDWTYLGPTIENSAKLTNKIHLYLASDCKKTGGQHLDKTETIDTVVMPLKEAVDLVMNGKIECNTTAHGILRAAMMNDPRIRRNYDGTF